MTTPDSTTPLQQEADYYASVTGLDRWTLAHFLALWALLDLRYTQASFVQDVLPGMVLAMSTAQRQAAELGIEHAERAQEAQGASETAGRVRPEAFSGIASDGRSLVGLLSRPLAHALISQAQGQDPVVTLAAGADELENIAVTQVHDAAREAEGTSMASNPGIRGYIRVVEPGACSRCILLAGRFFRWNAGFDRHPRCRCLHKELARDEGFYDGQDPKAIFDSLSRDEQNRIFTNDGAEAIRLGADIGRVVNARAGMSTVTGPTGRRDRVRTNVFGEQLFTTDVTVGRSRGQRLMPQSIIELADSRQDAIDLLKKYRYIY